MLKIQERLQAAKVTKLAFGKQNVLEKRLEHAYSHSMYKYLIAKESKIKL